MSELLLCAIGPVQDFIATARRSRDLQYGSWLLSELSKSVAQALAMAEGLECLVFPAPHTLDELIPDSPLNVANKVLAIVDQPPEELAKQAETALRARLRELREAAFRRIHSPHFERKLAEAQVDDLLEFYWVSVPFDPDRTTYGHTRQLAEALLTVRKNTRNFSSFPGAAVPKSSLDGSRESVIHEAAYPAPGDTEEVRAAKLDALYRDFGAHRGERLSGVDLLKRMGSLGRHFPSTADLAAAPFLDALGERAQPLLKALSDWLKARHPDLDEQKGTLLYPSRVAEWLTDTETEAYRRFLESQLRAAAPDLSPGAYYALLVADGDSMGSVLSKMGKPEEHRRLSQALSAFAVEAHRILTDYGGTPIYVGGDDIMAYLPLHRALDCLAELEQTFRQHPDIPATLSGGLVVAHYLHPLSEVLTLARQAEKQAKRMPGKNALCITLSKRSGAARTVRDRWPALVARLKQLAEFHRQEWISARSAYELQRLHQVLGGLGESGVLNAQECQGALQREALRVLERKRMAGGEDRWPQHVRDTLTAWLTRDGLSVEELALELILAAEFVVP